MKLQYLLENEKKIIQVSVLIILYVISILFMYKITKNYYKPVRKLSSSEKSPVGGIFRDQDDESKIKSCSFFHIKNHSAHEKKVTFMVYQNNIGQDEGCFFDIDYIYINRLSDDEKVIEDGIVNVPAGEKLFISIDATARDSSKALTSRSGPSVKIVNLD